MRRSAAITLTLLAASTGLGVAMCHRAEPDTEGVLESQAACIDRLGTDAAAECAAVFRSARVAHAGTAPRFGSAEACRAATDGDCTPLAGEPRPAGMPWASDASSVFIPAMAGVMIGRALSDGTRGAVPVYAGGMPPECLPGAAGCPPASSSGTGGSGPGGGSGGGGGRRYWYSGGSYAGSSDGAVRGGFRAATASGQGGTMLSRGASASRAGGFGFSAAAHGGGGS